MKKQEFKCFLKENWFILLFLLAIVGIFIFGVVCDNKATTEAKRCGLLGMSYTEYKETHTFTDYGTFNFYKHIAEERKAKIGYTEPIFTEAKPLWWEE
jgi:hypothetical protein